MNDNKKFSGYNQLLAERLSLFLNTNADFIEKSIIDDLVTQCGLSEKDAFSVVLCAALGFDTENSAMDREIFELYFDEMIKTPCAEDYRADPYYKNISVPEGNLRKWSFRCEQYKPYEAFVLGDLKKKSDGRIIPQIGFFNESFSFPAVLEDGREWMLITPNEIETMRPAVNAARGEVLTYGLGLGYFAYMASLQKNVRHVSIVERDESVIELFQKYILPEFENKEKIEIIHADAISYAESLRSGEFDFVFCDIWHDPSDGVKLYLQMKSLEKKGSRYMYWIEDTIKCYI